MKTEYQPISCAFHDQLEHFATIRKPVSVEYLKDGIKTTLQSAVLYDFSSNRDSKGILNEYVHIRNNKSELKIRMDHLTTIDGIIAADFQRGFC